MVSIHTQPRRVCRAQARVHQLHAHLRVFDGTGVLLGPSPVVAVKLISIFFDFICAFWVYKIVQLKYPGTRHAAVAGLLTLFAPTLVLNSAYWGQCDVIYTSWLLACLYFLLRQKEAAAFTAFGVAFAFKLQAIFFAPLLALLWLKGAVNWKSFFIIPLVYLAAITPAWLIGRPLDELLLVYLEQGGYFRELNKGAPNLYLWISNDYYDTVLPLGIAWTALVVGGVLAFARSSRAPINTNVLLLATLFTLAVPWLLPKMHDRYFFAADIISIVLAFYLPRHCYAPVIITTASLFAYYCYFNWPEEWFAGSLKIGALGLLVVILTLSYHLWQLLSRAKRKRGRRRPEPNYRQLCHRRPEWGRGTC